MEWAVIELDGVLSILTARRHLLPRTQGCNREFLVRFQVSIYSVLALADQGGNVAMGGYADETMSSHLHRLHRDGKPWGWLRNPSTGFVAWR